MFDRDGSKRIAALELMLLSLLLLINVLFIVPGDKSSLRHSIKAPVAVSDSPLNRIQGTAGSRRGDPGTSSINSNTTEGKQLSSGQVLAQQQGVNPFDYLPPFEPTCYAAWDTGEVLRCDPINCSQAVSCTVNDKSCCAYYNFQMLRDFDAFLVSKSLGSQYAIAYGSALGAYRDHTVIAHTQDIDMGLTPVAVQALQQNSTRLQLWHAGYAVYFSGIWRMCPHRWHPSADFRKRMVPYTHRRWGWINGKRSAVYTDLYLMWPKNSTGKMCDQLDFEDGSLAAATAFLDNMQTLVGRNHHGSMPTPGTLKQTAGSAPSLVTDYCIQGSPLPIKLQEGHRSVEVAGSSFPAPLNMEE